MDRMLAFTIIDRYFKSWLEQDKEAFLSLLHEEILVKECTGDTYNNKAIAQRWFEGWNKEGNKVLNWDISSRYYDQDSQVAVVEWKFECLYDYNAYSFLGSSIVGFKDELIIKLFEFQMDIDEKYPYQKV